jgi:hypothetical protein
MAGMIQHGSLLCCHQAEQKQHHVFLQKTRALQRRRSLLVRGSQTVDAPTQRGTGRQPWPTSLQREVCSREKKTHGESGRSWSHEWCGFGLPCPWPAQHPDSRRQLACVVQAHMSSWPPGTRCHQATATRSVVDAAFCLVLFKLFSVQMHERRYLLLYHLHGMVWYGMSC